MIRAVIVDDEPLARRALRQLLATHRDVQIIGEAGDAMAARKILDATDVDALFLDIMMPEVSGLDLAAQTGRRPMVVFVTAREEYGAAAFHAGAAEYVLKPVTQDRLDLALSRVRERLAAESDAERFRRLAEDTPAYVERFIARVGARDVVIPCDDVELIAADDVYASVHADGRRYLVRVSLDELERSLDPARFARVHRSYIVPIREVAAVRRRERERQIEMKNGVIVPVSRRRVRELARIDDALVRGRAISP